VLGNDIFFDSATEGRFVGYAKWTKPGGQDTVTLGTSLGRGKFSDVEVFNHINVVDLVWTHTINAKLAYNLEMIYGWQYNIARPGVQEGFIDDTGALAFQPSVGMAHWGSLVNYLFYTISPRLTSVFRLELFDDFDGHRTGFEGLYTAATVGMNFKAKKGLWIRPELRYDYNGESQPFEGKNWLLTASCDVIFRW
jgi:hypothetical protein